MAAVQVSDVVVPEIFTPYLLQDTAEKAALVQSGVLAVNPVLNNLLAGGGKTFSVPSFQDLDASDSTGADNVSTDSVADIQAATAPSGDAFPRNDSTPAKLETSEEVAVRLVRNKSWSSTGLAAELAGDDPSAAIRTKSGFYWTRRLQRAFVATFNGIVADNLAAPTGTEHVTGDLVNNVAGGSFVAGVTNFTAEAFIDAQQTMGDSAEDLGAIMVHSVVYSRMKKNNLIDFIPDSEGRVRIPTFQDLRVIIDDGMPRTGQVYDSWLFGAGAAQLGMASADVPVAVHREELAGNGGGQEILTTRQIWTIHPTGHAFIQGSIPNGGPSNANLGAAANWQRRYPERKQIKFAVLRTREA